MTDRDILFRIKKLISKVSSNQGDGVDEINTIASKFPSSAQLISSALFNVTQNVSIS